MVDGFDVPGWVASIAADLAASETAEVTAVVINRSWTHGGRPRHPHRPRPNVLRLAELYLYLDYRIFHPLRDAMEPVNLEDALRGFPVVETEPIFQGGRFSFSERDRRLLGERDLDVLLMFWSGLPADQVSSLARHGVWFFLDHERLFTGCTPVGFWEVLNRRAMTQCLQAQLAGSPQPMVLHEYHGPTNLRSIRLSRNDLLWKSVAFVSRTLNELYRVDSLDALPTFRTRDDALLGEAATNAGVVTPIVAHVARFLRNRRFERKYLEQWAMLYRFSPTAGILEHDLSDYGLLVPPKECFWADPFPVQVGDRYFLFFEEFVYSENKGHLCVAAIDPDGLQEEPRVLLKREAHLSYPFVFCWQGEWYLIPESQEENRIDVYKFDPFPYDVRYHTTLMEGVKAADTTLFEAHGRWWMFVAIATPGTQNFDELFLFHSDNPVGGWVPHPMNPIKSDVRSARPAGRVFARDGRYYRPSQDSSRRYGYAMRLQEIKILSEHDYVEEEVDAILPDWSPDVVATHTFNFSGALTVVDAQRRRRRIAAVPSRSR